jgi:hypothetical protein
MTPSGIEPATFWLLARCLFQPRHRLPPTTIRSPVSIDGHSYASSPLTSAKHTIDADIRTYNQNVMKDNCLWNPVTYPLIGGIHLKCTTMSNVRNVRDNENNYRINDEFKTNHMKPIFLPNAYLVRQRHFRYAAV